MLALNGADPLNGPRQWGSLLFCLVIVLSLQRAEGSTEETGSSYTKVRILPPSLPPANYLIHAPSAGLRSPRNVVTPSSARPGAKSPPIAPELIRSNPTKSGPRHEHANPIAASDGGPRARRLYEPALRGSVLDHARRRAHPARPVGA